MKAHEIEAAIRALIAAERTNLGVEVTVPVAYGDGEMTSVVVEERGDEILVHDSGASAMRLATAGVPLSKHVVRRLGELAHRYHCVFSEGRVSALATRDSLPSFVCLVANASRSVADYAYEIRRQAEYDFRIIVFDRLREIVGNRVRQIEEFKGNSGRVYRLPILLDRTETRPQNFVSALAHRNSVPQSFAMFYDLGAAYPDVERDAIYDETSDFRDEDRTFLLSGGAQVIGLMETTLRFKEMAGHA